MIRNLFMTPIYFKNTSYTLNKEQMKFLQNCEKKSNTFNKSSLNSYVLELPLFESLKKEVMNHIRRYAYHTLAMHLSIEIFMTQSWFNWTKQTEQHHKHEHPNSFISGVYYIDVDPKVDRIYFNKELRTDIRLVATEYNDYNSESFYFPVSNQDIIIFPSDLSHHVATKQDKKERISLAFNTYLKGKIGDEQGLWQLNI